MAANLERAMDYGRRAQQKLASMMEHSEAMVGHVKQTAEVAAGTFGMAVLAGRYGTAGQYKVAGVPVDLAAGAVLHGLAFAELAGKYDEDLHNVADGCLAYYLARTGVGVGQTMLDSHNKKLAGATTAPGALPAGSPPATSGYGYPQMGYSPLTAEEIAALAATAHR